ncbi:phage head closure protein [Litorimonas sp. WD9-15]|uniref:phage head closure protein n=1 Tax=Litorimonas sp. WD9-15 TaxID=3418716 RepID=UPI003CFF3A50
MIGQLRKRIGLYAPETVADDLGGTITTWAFQRGLWAAIQPRAISETRENGRLSVTQSYLVTIRYQTHFPERARLVWGDRILRVVAASDPDTRGERLHLICEEEKQ